MPPRRQQPGRSSRDLRKRYWRKVTCAERAPSWRALTPTQPRSILVRPIVRGRPPRHRCWMTCAAWRRASCASYRCTVRSAASQHAVWRHPGLRHLMSVKMALEASLSRRYAARMQPRDLRARMRPNTCPTGDTRVTVSVRVSVCRLGAQPREQRCERARCARGARVCRLGFPPTHPTRRYCIDVACLLCTVFVFGVGSRPHA